MSALPVEPGSPLAVSRPIALAIDRRRGAAAMWLFIATEAMLFVLLFFSYYYLGGGNWRWPLEEPPKLKYAIPMLIVLLASSVVLYWGERRVRKERFGQARLALGGTILLAFTFNVLQVFDYREALKTMTPQTNAYGSIFYTIVTLHAAHLLLGLAMLIYVLFLPLLDHREKPPHRPYHAASLYWHFVDVVWVFIVALIYVVPNLKR